MIEFSDTTGTPLRSCFPQAIPILDRYHAKETLHRTAQSIFGAISPEAKRWATARCTELDDGKLSAIVHALRPHIHPSNEATKCAMYIFRNRRRMRYPKFHALGLCTSTGVLEAGCKVVIGTRLKRHALDHLRRQRHHRPTLLQTQRTF